MIKDEVIKDAVIKSDSNLMVNQVNGKWKCKDSSLQVLCFKAQKRIDWLKSHGYKVELEYIPREFNLADEPAKLGAEEGKRLKQK
jgi:ribonuclease HI